MHLVYKALEKHAIPASLPPELLPKPQEHPVQVEEFANFSEMPPTMPAAPTIISEPIQVLIICKYLPVYKQVKKTVIFNITL